MEIRADWRTRLQRIVEERGNNLKALSVASGLNGTFLRDTFEKGTTPGLKSAQKLSNGLNVDIADWYIDRDGGPKPSKDQAVKLTTSIDRPRELLTKISEPPYGGAHDKVPVLGMAECGPDGWALWNGEVVDYAPRPPGLMGVEKGYAVFVVGESMEPRYFASELVYVHPGKPVTPGCFVLVQIQPKQDGEAPRAVLKRLVRRNGSKVVLEQFQPAKQFSVRAEEILSIHRVVGSGEA